MYNLLAICLKNLLRFYFVTQKKKLEKLKTSKLLVDEKIKDVKINQNSDKIIKRKSKKNKLLLVKHNRFIDSELPKSAVSDFIPLKTYKYVKHLCF